MASRNYSWFYQSAPDGLLMSASQYKLLMGCEARWGYKFLLRIRDEQSAKASAGNDLHEELEHWVKSRRMPKSKAALKAMRFSPAPGMAHAEAPIFYFIGSAGFVGFIDLVYNWEGELERSKGKVVPLTPGGHTVIHDWKFTSGLNNCLSPDELRNDDAANMYAYEAFVGGADRVSCRWVYVTFDGGSSREVWVEMNRASVEDHMRVMARNTELAWEKHKLFKQKKLTVLDLVKDTSHCFDYRRLCPYQTISAEVQAEKNCTTCQPLSRIKMPAPAGESPVSQTFLNHLDSFPGSTPGAKTPPPPPSKAAPPPPAKTAPPPPVKKAPPPPAKKPEEKDLDTLSDEEARALVADQLRAQGKDPSFANAPGPLVESGVVNSPRYAPETPAASPEQALEMQGGSSGVEQHTEHEHEPDELDALDKAQLRALAIHEGVIDEKKRPREDTLRQMIRAFRIEQKAKLEAGKVATGTEEELDIYEPAGASEIEPPPAGSKENTRGWAITEPAEILEDLHANLEGARDRGEAIILRLPRIIDAANLHLFNTHEKKPREWGLIQFEGAARLCCAVTDLFQAGTLQADVVVFDSNTREGGILKNTLASMAYDGKFILIDGNIVA